MSTLNVNDQVSPKGDHVTETLSDPTKILTGDDMSIPEQFVEQTETSSDDKSVIQDTKKPVIKDIEGEKLTKVEKDENGGNPTNTVRELYDDVWDLGDNRGDVYENPNLVGKDVNDTADLFDAVLNIYEKSAEQRKSEQEAKDKKEKDSNVPKENDTNKKEKNPPKSKQSNQKKGNDKPQLSKRSYKYDEYKYSKDGFNEDEWEVYNDEYYDEYEDWNDKYMDKY